MPHKCEAGLNRRVSRQGNPVGVPLLGNAGNALSAFLILCVLLVGGCSRNKSVPPYSPHENVLSLTSEFLLLASKDPYREESGQDLTGQSITRSTLVRLANYEALHPGRLTPEVLFLRARALELLGDYRSAIRNYQECGEFDTELRAEAARRGELLERMMVAGGSAVVTDQLEGQITDLATRATDLRRVVRMMEDRYYSSLAMREAEQMDVVRAELMATHRYLLPDGERQAVDALEALVSNHRESRRALAHALRLARFHKALAEEEVRINPPEGPGFSVDRFQVHYDRAVDLLYRISQADGRPEKNLARFELDAMLAFGEQIRERAR